MYQEANSHDREETGRSTCNAGRNTGSLAELLQAIDEVPNRVEPVESMSVKGNRAIDKHREAMAADLMRVNVNKTKSELNMSNPTWILSDPVLSSLVHKNVLENGIYNRSAFSNAWPLPSNATNGGWPVEFGAFPSGSSLHTSISPNHPPYPKYQPSSSPSTMGNPMPAPSLQNLILFSQLPGSPNHLSPPNNHIVGPSFRPETQARASSDHHHHQLLPSLSSLPASLASTLASTRASALLHPTAIAHSAFSLVPFQSFTQTTRRSSTSPPSSSSHGRSTPLLISMLNATATSSNSLTHIHNTSGNAARRVRTSKLPRAETSTNIKSQCFYDEHQHNLSSNTFQDTFDCEPVSASSSSTASAPASPNSDLDDPTSASCDSSNSPNDLYRGTSNSPALLPGCSIYSDYIADLRSVCPRCSASGRLKSKKKPLVDSLLLLAFFNDGIKKTPNGQGYIIDDSNLARELMNSISSHIRPPSRGTNNSYDNWKRAMGKTFRKSGTFFTPKDEETARYAKHVEEHLTLIFESKKNHRNPHAFQSF